MAILTSRATAATVNALITKVRRAVGDTDSDTNNQRWSSSDILAEMDHCIAEMYVEATGGDPSGFLLATDMTYTASARSVALPTGLEGSQIYKIEDVTTQTSPTYVTYRPVDQVDRFGDEDGWSLQAQAINDAGTITQAPGGAIALRPIPSAATTLRVYTIGNFLPVSTAATPSTDQHPMNVNNEELIVLGTAIRLQEIDNEVPVTRIMRHQKLWEAYQVTCSRVKGPVYVKPTRILL